MPAWQGAAMTGGSKPPPGGWDSLPDAEALERLRKAFCPGWEVWNVPTWDGVRGGLVWCARHQAGGVLLHGDTAGHLAEYIDEAEVNAAARRHGGAP